MFAQIIAKEIGYKYMCVSQADFASSMVGESLHKLRAVFKVALESAPCVLFFGTIDIIRIAILSYSK